MAKIAKDKALVAKALESVNVLEERVEALRKMIDHGITNLYLEFLSNCEEHIVVFEHYMKFAVHHFLFILFELKILSNGRLHNEKEESRYAEYLDTEARGHFIGQDFMGHDSEVNCRLSKLSCDGIYYGVLRKVNVHMSYVSCKVTTNRHHANVGT